MKTTLVIATGNAGKVKEFQKILGDTQFEFKTLKDIGFTDEIVEDGDSFAANAEIKARAVYAYLQKQNLPWPVLADDSGLEVRALHNEPGIYTARYAGVGASDQQNYEKLLQNLATQTDRAARFVCWLCWFDGITHKLFEGYCAGHVLLEPRGSEGFGYDPVFEPDGYARSFGEMSHDEKKALSHRGEAIKHLQAWLANR
jgi:XTP/dITP diphosphohydrolase